MNRFQTEKNHSFHRLLLPALVFLCLMCFLFYGMSSVSSTTQKEEERSLKQAVIRSAVHCYAVEGSYPESLTYLEDHYGITYDHDKYLVTYEVVGSNLMPDVDVIPLNNREVAP
ncbi:MAG: hypothetical protein ACLRMZ_16725 [Blautia marasmi]